MTDATGKPVQGAIVVTRTADRDFWTFSSPSDAQGHYSSFFSAADEQGADPVPLAVQVAVGPLSYGGATGTNFNFKRLSSSTLDVQLGKTTAAALPASTPSSYAGAVYEGLVVGVNIGGHVIKPVSERWPDATRQLLDGASRLDAREDTALLGEPPSVLLALPRRIGRPGRSRVVAHGARLVGSRRPRDARRSGLARRHDRRRRVERAVDVVHEVRRRDHLGLERVQRAFVERDVEPGGRRRIEERDPPRRTTVHGRRPEDVCVGDEAPTQAPAA